MLKKNINHLALSIVFKSKIYKIFSIFIFLIVTSKSVLVAQVAQSIELINFDNTLTYFPGGSVSVLFEPKGFFPMDNVFKLELSDASGSFANPTILATEAEFFTPILNGKIPTTIPVGTGYKLRISYGPEVGTRVSSELPNAFSIGTVTSAFTIPYIGISPNAEGIDFLCLNNPNTVSNPNYFFGSVKQSSTSILPEGLVITEFKGTWAEGSTIKMYSNTSGNWSSIPLIIEDQFGKKIKIPDGSPVGYYLIQFTKTVGGKSLSYSYLFNYNTGNTGFSNISSESVCVGSAVDFEISIAGIAKNYPGSKYTIDFGDGSDIVEYTHNELVANPFVSHEFTEPTSSSADADVVEGKLFFKIDFNLFNKGLNSNCEAYSLNGNGTSKYVNASRAPLANFSTDPYLCERNTLKAIDTSIPGQYGDTNTYLSDILKDWYVTPPGGSEERVNLDRNPDGTLVVPVFEGWLDSKGDLQIPGQYVTPGCWTIRLLVYNPSAAGCRVRTDISKSVNVERIPDPSFTFAPSSPICDETEVVFTNTSNVLDPAIGCQNPTYEWKVVPIAAPAIASGFTFTNGTSASIHPTIKFTEPGSYNVILEITNSCGTFLSAPQQIDVLGAPTVVFNPSDLEICQKTPAPFELDFSDADIAPQFGVFPFAPDTYIWEVFKLDDTPADPSTYEFVAPSTSLVPFPKIKFKSFGVYKIKITVTTVCNGSAFDFFTFGLKQEPEITNTNLTQTICSGGTTEEIVFTSTMPGSSFSWTVAPVSGLSGYVVSGFGAKINAATITNSTNAPLDLVYEVIATNDDCSSDVVAFTITVNPTPEINNKTELICSRDSFSVSPVDGLNGDIVPAGTTYTWTVVDNPAVTGQSDVTVAQPNISQTLTNLSNEVQTVTYTVTPRSGAVENCLGASFQLEVTVNPVAQVVATPASAVICTGDQALIDLTSNTVGTEAVTYSWTASVTTPPTGGAITGFSDHTAKTLNTIAQTLTNGGTSSGVVTYVITSYIGACAGTSISVPVTVNPDGQVNQVSDQVICQGGSTEAVVFQTLNSGGATSYAWAIDKAIGSSALTGTGGIPSFVGINSTNASIVATVTVTPTFTNGDFACEGEIMSFTITVNPVAQVEATPASAVICTDETTSIELKTPTSGSQSVTYSWTASVTTPPAGGTITGFSDHTAKTLDKIEQILRNTGTTPGEVTYTITPHIGSCSGTPLDVVVTVNPVAQVNPVPAQVLCAGENTDLTTFGTINTGGTTTYAWSNTNTDIGLPATSVGSVVGIPIFTANNPTNLPITATITVTPTFTNGSVSCQGSPISFTITVNPTPVISAKTELICSGDFFTVSPVDGLNGDIVPAGTTYTWTVVDNPAVTGQSDVTVAQPNISQTLTNLSNEVQTVTYTVTPTSGAAGNCVGAPFQLEVMMNPIAQVVATPASAVICTGDQALIDLTSSTVGTEAVTFGWTASVTTPPTGGAITGFSDHTAKTLNTIAQTLTNGGTSSGVVTYVITSYIGACAGTSISVPVTVNPDGQVNQVSDQVICQGGSTEAVVFQTLNSGGATSYAWAIDKAIGSSALTGTGGIPSFVGINSTNASIVATVTVTPTFTNGDFACEGEIMSFTITVNPVAQVEATPASAVICTDETTSIELKTPTSGSQSVTYSWTASVTTPPAGGTITGFSDHTAKTLDKIEQILRNTGTTPGEVTYTITPHIGSCSGTPLDVVVTVNPVAQVNPVPAQVLCAGENTDLTTFGTINTGGTTTYAWSNTNTDIGLPATSVGSVVGIPIFTANNPTNLPITATITVTPTFTNGSVSCQGSPISFTITVNPTPVISAKTELICSGDFFTVSPVDGLNGDIVPAGTTYTWTVVDNPAVTGQSDVTVAQPNISQTLTNLSNEVQTVTYTVTPTSGAVGNCVGASFQLEVMVNPVAQVVATPASAVICTGDQALIDLTSNTVGTEAVTYSWTASVTTPPTGGAITGFSDHTAKTLNTIAQTLTNGGTSSGVVTYVITSYIGACAGTSISVPVTVNPDGQVNQVSDQVICQGGSTEAVVFQTRNSGGATSYAWAIDKAIGSSALTGTGGIPSFVGTNSTNASIVATVTVTPTFTNGDFACEGEIMSFTITVNPVAQVEATPASAVICTDETTSIELKTPTSGSQSVTYSWTASVTTPPAGGTITGFSDHTAKTLDKIEQILRNTGTTPGEVTYTITPHIGSCSGTPLDVVVTVNPVAQVNPVPAQVLCAGENTDLTTFGTINTGGTTTYAWSNTNTDIGLPATSVGSVVGIPIFTANNPTNLPITATITVTPTFTNGSVSCQGSPISFTITVNPTPVISAKTELICSGDFFTVSPVDGLNGDIVPAGTTYTWTVVDNPAVTGQSDVTVAQPNISQTLTNLSNEVQTVTYTVTPRSGAVENCLGASFQLEVTVNPTAVISDKIPAAICSGDSFTVTPANGVNGDIVPAGTTYTWTVVENLNVTGDQNESVAKDRISQTLRNLTIAPQTVVYTVTPLVGSCVGATFTVRVTVNPTAEISAKTAVICSGDSFTVTPANGIGRDIVPDGTDYTWTVVDNPAVTGQSDVAIAQPNISQTLTNTSNIVQTVIYTVTPRSGDAGNCVGAPFQLEVTVSPRPFVKDDLAVTCSNVPFEFVATNGNGNIVPAGTLYTWTIKTDAPSLITGQSIESTPRSKVSQELRNLTKDPQVLVYEVTPILGTCVGPVFELAVTVNPTPVISAKTELICSGDSFTVTPANGIGGDIVPTGTTYTWTVVINSAVTGETGESIAKTVITQQLTNTSNIVQTVTYTVTPRSGAAGSCVGAPFQLEVTVNPTPEISAKTELICSRDSFTVSPVDGLNGDIVPAGTTYTWTVVDNPAVTGETSESVAKTLITQQLTNTSNDVQTVTYTVIPKSGNCVGASFQLAVTVQPTAVISDKELLICSGDVFDFTPAVGINGDIVPAGTRFTWVVIPNSSITGAVDQLVSQASILITQPLINTGIQPENIIYRVTPITPEGCRGVSFDLVVTVKDPIVINGQPRNYNGFGISCFGADDGEIEINPTGGKLPTDVPSYTYSWIGPNEFTSSTQNIFNLKPGVYTVTVSDGNGVCSQSKEFTITEPLPISVVSVVSDYNGFEISCFGADDGKISSTVSGGSSSYTYTWTARSGGTITSGQENQKDLNGLIAGTYDLNILDSNGCSFTQTFILDEPPLLVLTEDVDERINVLCFGEATGKIEVVGYGGTPEYSYSLIGKNYLGEVVSVLPSATLNNIYEFGNLKAGIYTLTVKDKNGCEISIPTKIEIKQPAAPLSIDGDVKDYNGFNVSCFGKTNGDIKVIVAGGVPPYRYQWSGPNGFSSTSLNITNLAAGQYIFTLKDANDCVLTQNFQVFSPEKIEVELLAQNVLCGGENNGNIFIRSVKGGNGSYQFVWVKDGVGEIKRSFIPEDLRNIGPGRYTLITTDANFCEDIQTFVITEPVPLVISLGNKVDNKCFGDSGGSVSVDVTGGTESYNYSWQGPNGYTSTSKNIVGLKSGRYELTIVDALACEKKFEIEITEPREIVLNEINTPVSCFGGSDGSIATNVSGGVGPFRYEWSGPNGFNSTNKQISNVKAGTYQLTIFDTSSKCLVSFPLVITAPDPIVLNPVISDYNGFQIGCRGGSDGSIGLNINGGTGSYTVIWEGPNGFSSSLLSISNLVAGTYEVAVKDGKGCFKIEKFILLEPTELLVSKNDVSIQDVSCFAGSDGVLTVTMKQGSVPPYNYELSGTAANGFPVSISTNSVNTSYQFNSLRAGKYKLVITDANGCYLSEIVGLEVSQPLTALSFTVQKQDILCYKGNTGQLAVFARGGTAPYTILWNNGATTFSLENLPAGTYTAILKDANDCQVVVSEEIKEAPIFESTPEVSQISCFGEKDGSILLKIIGGVTPVKVKWAHGPETPDLYNLSSGVYRATITDAKGCIIRKDFAINEPFPLAIAGQVTDALDCDSPLSGSITSQVSGGTAPYTYLWNIGESTPSISSAGPGNYSVQVTDSRGCTILKQFTIQRPLPLEIFGTQSSVRICNPRGLESTFNLVLSNGLPPYQVSWSRGTQTNDGLMMVTNELGLFTATVTDSRGCVFTKTFTVTEKDPIVPDFNFLSSSAGEYRENLVNFEVNFQEFIQGNYKEVQWEFGDGSASNVLNPTHKYKKAGKYTITLKVKGDDRCIVSAEKEIIITDFFLEIPNVFTPNGDGINDYYFPKFIHIHKINLLVMNIWGELIYASENLDDQGWDGMSKGEKAPAGNYVYKITYTTLDGREFTESSTFLLAR
jgi:gliding motility-associated-like protein